MDAPTIPEPEETRFVRHLSHVGYSLEADADPNGWRFATSPMALPLCFRVVGTLICLYARYSVGRWHQEAHDELLRVVNEINASHWLVRCTAIRCDGDTGEELAVSLEANLPARLPTQELGACVFTWIAESGRVQRITRSYLSRSDDGPAADEHRSAAEA